MINYKEMGLSKPEVLCALYNNADVQGLGYIDFVPGNMTVEIAEGILKRTTSFDYYKGRVMKVDLSSDESFEEQLYDRDNGKDAAIRSLNDYLAHKQNHNGESV